MTSSTAVNLPITTSTSSESEIFNNSIKGTKILLKNLGPIKKAKIELSDFVVVIGPNASGKTFLMLATDSILSATSQFFSFSFVHVIHSSLLQVLKEDNPKGGFPINIDMSKESAILRNKVATRVKKQLIEEPVQKQLQGFMQSQLLKYFSVPPQQLISFGSDHCEIKVEFQGLVINAVISHSGSPLDVKMDMSDKLTSIFVSSFTAQYINGQGAGSYRMAFNPFNLNSVLIPAERISVLATLPEILDNIARQTGYQYMYPQIVPNQSTSTKPTIVEFLSKYMSAIDNVYHARRTVSSVAADLLGGKPVFEGNLPSALMLNQGGNLVPQKLMASGQAQLLPLLISIEGGFEQFVLIEEPEVNLHANKHVEVADYLWQVNKLVLVTSHSDYLVMRLAHLWAKNKKFKELSVFFLNKGITRKLSVKSNGEIEEIETIANAINKLLLDVQT